MSMTKYKQGRYTVRNYLKYDGDPTNVYYRSGWEKLAFLWLDNSEACVKWNSEEIVIPYRSPVDGEVHRYYPDLKATIKQRDVSVKTFLIEIKPFDQTIPPKNTRNKKALMESVATYQINQAKWVAAKSYCESKGFDFMLITEFELGLKKRS